MSFVRLVFVVLAVMLPLGATAQVAAFVGDYAGTAEVETWDGETVQRDMSVSIRQAKDGFEISWNSTTWRDGKGKSKAYRISFVPTERDSVFAAAMTRNVFGHEVPLDPMKGEPYVWARIQGETLTVFSMYISATGGYEMQQFDRTLVPGGLRLDFAASGDGKPRRELTTVLKRQ